MKSHPHPSICTTPHHTAHYQSHFFLFHPSKASRSYEKRSNFECDDDGSSLAKKKCFDRHAHTRVDLYSTFLFFSNDKLLINGEKSEIWSRKIQYGCMRVKTFQIDKVVRRKHFPENFHKFVFHQNFLFLIFNSISMIYA